MPKAKRESYIDRPQGAPRGLLVHFILYKISQKPYHGYELLQEIEEKTAGGWRPGPGSIYPMLKKLVSDGYIKSVSSKKSKTAQTAYEITARGKQHMNEMKKVFTNAGQKWSALSRIFMEIIEPADLPNMFIDGSRMQFEISREMLQSKMDRIAKTDLEYVLREYSLNLQRQLDWSNEILDTLKHANQPKAEAKIQTR